MIYIYFTSEQFAKLYNVDKNTVMTFELQQKNVNFFNEPYWIELSWFESVLVIQTPTVYIVSYFL